MRKIKIAEKVKERTGSESLELLIGCCVLAMIAVTLIFFLLWVYDFYNMSAIARKVTRTIEVTGVYDATAAKATAEALSGVTDETAYNYVTLRCYYTDNDGHIGAELSNGDKVNLGDTFVLIASSRDRIPLAFADGTYITVPISCKSAGISEMYFKP